MEFKAGDKVKIEGILEENDISDVYPLFFVSNDTRFSMTTDGRIIAHKARIVQLVERPKPKVKKYKVLYQDYDSDTPIVSKCYYKDFKDFHSQNKSTTFLQLLESTEKEFEE